MHLPMLLAGGVVRRGRPRGRGRCWWSSWPRRRPSCHPTDRGGRPEVSESVFYVNVRRCDEQMMHLGTTGDEADTLFALRIIGE